MPPMPAVASSISRPASWNGASDDQLRGVLAHEVAHADLGHVAKAQALGTGLNIGMIILDQIIPGTGLITPLIPDLGVMRPFSASLKPTPYGCGHVRWLRRSRMGTAEGCELV